MCRPHLTQPKTAGPGIQNILRHMRDLNAQTFRTKVTAKYLTE